MKKLKVMYVVSTLARSGPTNQLLNIIRNLDEEIFQPIVLTLSPEPRDSLKFKYDELNIDVLSLDLSRVQGLLYSKTLLLKAINDVNPSVIHTQGIRADVLLSKFNLDIPWIMTSRNYPFDDYPMKFGRFKGVIMARSHIAAMKKCSNVISCSKTIAQTLRTHGVNTTPIQNGVHIEQAVPELSQSSLQFESPVFVSVGSLIPRKNMSFIVDAFKLYLKENKGSLVILGGGPELTQLREHAKSRHIYIEGSVSNVRDYLAKADYFVSSSLSEGLPNTVLEGLSAGLPALLSNIPSHLEIEAESPKCVNIFELESGIELLSKKMMDINGIFSVESSISARHLARSNFSAESMSKKYQQLYKELALY